nr:MAG TPA: hypothetical protein [Caudoviricetes sp.]
MRIRHNNVHANLDNICTVYSGSCSYLRIQHNQTR